MTYFDWIVCTLLLMLGLYASHGLYSEIHERRAKEKAKEESSISIKGTVNYCGTNYAVVVTKDGLQLLPIKEVK